MLAVEHSIPCEVTIYLETHNDNESTTGRITASLQNVRHSIFDESLKVVDLAQPVRTVYVPVCIMQIVYCINALYQE